MNDRDATTNGESAEVDLPHVAPDCKKPEEALSRLVAAIHAVPLTARHIDFTFGRRNRSAGGGWYWGVCWTMGAGSTEQRPRPADVMKVTQAAIAHAVEYMQEVAAEPPRSGSSAGEDA